MKNLIAFALTLALLGPAPADAARIVAAGASAGIAVPTVPALPAQGTSVRGFARSLPGLPSLAPSLPVRGLPIPSPQATAFTPPTARYPAGPIALAHAEATVQPIAAVLSPAEIGAPVVEGGARAGAASAFLIVRGLRAGVAPALSSDGEVGLTRLMDGAGRRMRGDANAVLSFRGTGLFAGTAAALLPAEAGEGPAPRVETRRSAPPREIEARFWKWESILAPILTTVYRLRLRGLENVPEKGAVLLLPNHVTWLDVLLISYAVRRPVRFLMFKPYRDHPLLNWFVKGFEPIPLVPGDAKQVEWALAEAQRALAAGDAVAVFPEGSFTYDGTMKRFKRGLETIARGTSAPVVAVHLDGFWGSIFSQKEGTSLWKSLRRLGRVLTLRFGAPLEHPTVDTVRDAVEQLGAMSMAERVRTERRPLGRAFIDAAFEHWTAKAVSDSTGRTLTYGKLLTASSFLAAELAPGLKDAQNVGVLLPPSVGGALANVALALLGKTSVNLNYTAAIDSVRHAARLSGVTSVITSRRFVEELQKRTGRRYDIPGEWVYLEDVLAGASKWKQAITYISLRVMGRKLATQRLLGGARTEMDDDATIIFTSGSTAEPKGVRLSHLNVQANITMMEELFSFRPTEVMLGVLPFFHSFGFTETLWLPLLNGVHAVYHANPFEAEAIDGLSRRFKPSLLLSTPTFLRRYTAAVSEQAFKALRIVVAGAEKLHTRDADGFEEKFGIRPLEGYGATETSPVSAVGVPDSYRIRKGETVLVQEGHRDGSVGKPPPGVAIRIVDPETGGFLPSGEAGHVLIRGPHVTPGYYGDAPRSAAVLKDGWYHTGDIGLRDRDGFLYITGRISRFSKIAGELVSHDLVEEKLQEASGKPERAFTVAGVPDAGLGEKLIVLHTDFGMTPEQLLAKVGDSLSKIATPRAVNFFRVAEFPMLGSGKLDLKAVAELSLKLDGERGTVAQPAANARPAEARKPESPAQRPPEPSAPKRSLSRALKYGYVFGALGLVLVYGAVSAAQALGYVPHSDYQAPVLPPSLGFSQAVSLVALGSVFAPIVEELVFRVGLLGGLEAVAKKITERWAGGIASVLSSVLFVVVHETADPLLIGVRFFDALALAWVYKRAGLAASIVQHAVHNGLVIAGLLASAFLGPAAFPLMAAVGLANLVATAVLGRSLWKQRADEREGRLLRHEVTPWVARTLAILLSVSALFLPADRSAVALVVVAGLLLYSTKSWRRTGS